MNNLRNPQNRNNEVIRLNIGKRLFNGYLQLPFSTLR